MTRTILVIDGNSIMNRAFYGIRPLTNKDGLPTNAVYGTVNIMVKHLEALKPDYAAVAFDLKAPTFRHKMYDKYKAGRHAMPDELAVQLPYVKRVCELMGFKVLSLEGYEADDIIGTIARFADRDSDLFSYVLTGDRDSLQLIDKNINVLLAGNSDTVRYDKTAFFDKYGVMPDTFVDVKALMGDSSDNIPGVAGIGEKTALKLIAEYGSLDKVYENIDSPNIAKGVKAKLGDDRDAAYLSQKLARIDCNVPIGLDLQALSYNGFDKHKLLKLFTELEFGALIKRLGLDVSDPKSQDGKATVEHTSTPSSLKEIQSKLDSCEHAALTVGFGGDTPVVTVSFDGTSEYTCFASTSELDSMLTKYSHKLIVYDLKSIFRNTEIDCQSSFLFDIKLGAYVADSSTGKYEPDRLALKYLEENFTGEEASSALIYRLYAPIREELEKTGSLRLLNEIEMPLTGVLSSMEKEGFKIDADGLIQYGEALGKAADEIAERIYFHAGCEFNINSPKQLGDILFVKLALPCFKKTKTGFSTGAEVLEKLAPYHPIISEILDYRQIVKLKSTYTDALAAQADKDGLVHTSFNQTVTATGRLSSTEPNLQNIPIRTSLGHELRKFFIPRDKDRVLIDADYSQIELRLLAHISDDENMINAFLSGVDIHTVTASQVFGVEIDEVTSELRKRAKAVNFGIVYGIGDFSLSQDLGVSKKEAAEYIRDYKAGYPKVDKYLRDVITRAYEDGYVTTEFGRRRYIPELSSGKAMLKKFGERVAMNSPIQGTAADIIKIAMINVYRALKDAGIDAKLTLQVHDELMLDANVNCAEEAAQILKREMERVADFKVPLTTEVSMGDTWFECK